MLSAYAPSLASPQLNADAIKSLQLPGPFTLTYNVVHRNVMSAETKADLLQQIQIPLDIKLSNHQITQKQLDDRMKKSAEGLDFPPMSGYIKLSVLGNRSISQGEGYNGPGRRVFIFDGQQSLDCTPAEGYLQRISQGLQPGSVQPTIVPGVGTPYASLIENPVLSGKDNEHVVTFTGDVMPPAGTNLVPGEVKAMMVDGHPQILSLVEYTHDRKKVMVRWDFLEHKLFQGVWIASHMTYTRYSGGTPSEVFDLTLSQASAKSVDVDEFRFEHWLPKRAALLTYLDNFRSTVPYEVGHGTWSQQARNAMSKEVPDANPPKPGSTIAVDSIEVGSDPHAFNCSDLDGHVMSLESHRGKVVLVEFWATWCFPCREETPYLVKAYKKYHDQGFDILSFSDDLLADSTPKSAAQKIRAFSQHQGIQWPIAFDKDSALALASGLGGAIPTNYLVGRDGKVCAIDLRGEGLELAVKTALKSK